VVQHACLFLGKHNYATGTVRKSLKHFATLLATTYFDATWGNPDLGSLFATGETGGLAQVHAADVPAVPAQCRRRP
jgi:hypothetical protein